jgi:hypothetical protein
MKYVEIVCINEIYEEGWKIYVDGHFMTDLENDLFDTECMILNNI